MRQFASDLDQSTKNLLARGERLTELLKQPVYHPMPVAEEVIAIFAGVRGYLDKIPVGEVKSFEAKALAPSRLPVRNFWNRFTKKRLSPKNWIRNLPNFSTVF